MQNLEKGTNMPENKLEKGTIMATSNASQINKSSSKISSNDVEAAGAAGDEERQANRKASAAQV